MVIIVMLSEYLRALVIRGRLRHSFLAAPRLAGRIYQGGYNKRLTLAISASCIKDIDTTIEVTRYFLKSGFLRQV